MEEMVEHVKGVLKKYGMVYSKRGIEKNLNVWQRNKHELINLLRNHPNWNEDALAIVMDVEEIREISIPDILESLSDVELLHPVFDNNQVATIFRMNDYAMYTNALHEVVMPFQKNASSDTAKSVKEYADIRCTEGEKSSKVVNKICDCHGINIHGNYNKLFAKLSDNINPNAIKRKVILSVHPCDYLEMSNKDNSWKSCHQLRYGEYQNGTISYMNDSVSMIFYSINVKNVESDFFMLPKINREVFCYKDGILLQSRLYPNDNNEKTKRLYGDVVKEIFSICHQTENLWKVGSIDDTCETHSESSHYPDYEHGYGDVFLLSGTSAANDYMLIGEEGYCMYCGEVNHEKDRIDCEIHKMHYCSVCGEDIHEEEIKFLDNNLFCEHCYEQFQSAPEEGNAPDIGA